MNEETPKFWSYEEPPKYGWMKKHPNLGGYEETEYVK